MKEPIDLGGGNLTARERFVARAVGTKFDIRALSSGGTEIEIYDEISPWGVDARSFRARLKEANGDLTIRINSPGGLVTDGVAIYNDLLAYQGRKRVEITGLCASIATIIAMAGDEIAIAENAFFMVHNAWGAAIGDHRDMRNVADVLAKMSDAMARTYAANAKGLGIRAIKQMMDDETWFTGKEAKDAGFATEILAPAPAKAKFDLSTFTHCPDAIASAIDDEGASETIRDIERRLRDAGGFTRKQATAIAKMVAAGEQGQDEATRDAGGERLVGLLGALKAANAAFNTPR